MRAEPTNNGTAGIDTYHSYVHVASRTEIQFELQNSASRFFFIWWQNIHYHLANLWNRITTKIFYIFRIITLKQQKFSESDPVLILQFLKKLQSDPVLTRQKLASDLMQSAPVLIRAHLSCLPHWCCWTVLPDGVIQHNFLQNSCNFTWLRAWEPEGVFPGMAVVDFSKSFSRRGEKWWTLFFTNRNCRLPAFHYRYLDDTHTNYIKSDRCVLMPHFPSTNLSVFDTKNHFWLFLPHDSMNTSTT